MLTICPVSHKLKSMCVDTMFFKDEQIINVML